jgi:cell division protein FtsQ
VRRWRDRLPSRGELAALAARALRRSTPALIALGVVAAVALAVWIGHHWLTTSPRFAIAAIDVRGCERLDANAVRRATGIATGANVFTLDTAAVERRLEAEPWIASASVERELPDRVIATIEEHVPAALVDLGGLYLVDAAGRPFKRAAIGRGEGAGLIAITGLARADYLADEAAAGAAIRSAMAAAREYQRVPARPAVGEAHIDARGGISLITYDSGLAVRLGAAGGEALAQRLAAFDVAWAALGDDERAAARMIFADSETNPDRVTVRFGGTN